jgi:hypothetical protein
MPANPLDGFSEAEMSSNPRTIMVAICLSLMAIASSAVATNDLVDDRLAAKAEVVLRVRYISSEGADKYAWYRVQVLRVFKNGSDENVRGTMSIAAYGWKAGVPQGESTLYLERYNKDSKGVWKLVAGEASTGVSHPRKP